MASTPPETAPVSYEHLHVAPTTACDAKAGTGVRSEMGPALNKGQVKTQPQLNNVSLEHFTRSCAGGDSKAIHFQTVEPYIPSRVSNKLPKNHALLSQGGYALHAV